MQNNTKPLVVYNYYRMYACSGDKITYFSCSHRIDLTRRKVIWLRHKVATWNAQAGRLMENS